MTDARWLGAVSAALLSACSGPSEAGKAEERRAVQDTSAVAGGSTLYGTWRIEAVNGAPARSSGADAGNRPHVTFTPDGYGGHSGCNAYGGDGLVVGDRWFAGPATATQQGCSDLEAQESGILSILSSGPTFVREGADVLVLRVADRSLRLRRAEGSPGTHRPEEPPMLLAGTSWELHSVDVGPTDPAGARDAARLTFEADRWTLAAPCATRTGAWRQADGAILMEAGETVRRSCSPAQAVADEALGRALAGQLRYVVGRNGEFVLAGREHWVVGWRDASFGAEPDLLSGEWRITAVDGGPPPPPRERPADAAFGPGYYGLWDGCRHSEGVAILHQRRLFTYSSGVATAANCPDDPTRLKINAVVAAAPRVARLADGGLALMSRRGVLTLQRTSQRPFGTGVRTRLRSGEAFDLPTGPNRAARLTLGPGDRYTLALSCGTVTGRWRSRPGVSSPAARFGPEVRLPDCPAPEEQRLHRFFMGDVRAAIGPNRDIALFVNRDASLPARVVPSRGG